MPEPVAAPVAAPAAAPVSTSTPTATPSTASEHSSTPVAAPATESPTTETPAAKPERPSRSEFSADAQGIEDFLKANNAYDEANPDGTQLVTGDEIPVVAEPAAEKTPEEIAAEADAAADKEVNPDKPKEVEAPTPEALAALIDGNEARKAFLESDPEFKGKIFAIGRENAKLAPFGKMFANVEAGKFALENANQFVGLKTAFQLSDSPEKMKDAAGMFLEQFQIVDDKGQPVLDAKGQPTFGEDLPLFVSEIKNRDTTARIDDIKARIESGQYSTEEGKENDEQLLAAYEFIQAYESADPAELDKPDTSKMDPATKAYFEKKESELAKQREELGLKEKNLSAKQKTEVRERNNLKYKETFGASSGKFMSNYLAQKEKEGVVIPHYMLTMKNPKTGISVFAMTAFDRLNEKLDKLSDVKSSSATLQMNALNDDGLAARVKYGQELIDEHLPGIIDQILSEAGVSIAKDAANKIASRDDKRKDARVEPSGGGTITPKSMSPEQLIAKAKQNVIANAKGEYIAPGEMIRKTLVERDRLEAQR